MAQRASLAGMADTTERWERFLEMLAETGHVEMAAEAVGMRVSSVYRHRKDHPEFAARWKEAVAVAVEGLEAEAVRRARFGVAEPVFYQGEQCGTIQRYSDQLLALLLRAKKPEEYRERSDVQFRGTVDLAAMSDEELRTKALEARAALGQLLGSGGVDDLL